MTRLERQYRSMLTIRRFEERVLDLFGRDLVSGTTHTYIGQEAIAVALMQHVKEGDIIFSNHRCHGHYLAYGALGVVARRNLDKGVRHVWREWW